MSFLDEVNEDAISIAPEQAATGPRVGFLDAFETSYNTQVRTSAMYGIEKAMHERDAEQVDALRKAGVEDIPKLSDGAFGFFGKGAFSGDYLDAAKFYEDGGEPGMADRLAEYDAKIDALREKHPDLNLRNSRDMWDETKAKAQEYEKRSNTERTTWGGALGGFIGGAVGGMNVESDPLNFATAPIGGVGKGVISRIAGQGAAQGFVEGINQVTGVQTERRLLGLSTGVGDALSRVGQAAIGGAALQGAGEAAGALFRGAKRIFRDAPDLPDAVPVRDPTPDTSQVPSGAIPADENLAAAKLENDPYSYIDYLKEVSPWSISKLGQARSILDIDYMTTKLDAWDGSTVADIAPRAETRIFDAPNDMRKETIFDRMAEKSQLDDAARRVDPDTFRIFDAHADDKAAAQAVLRTAQSERATEVDQLLGVIDDKITELKDRLSRSGAMKGKKLKPQIEALSAERDAYRAELLATDTPFMTRARARAMRADEKMRDLAPMVSGAYARAKGKWDANAADRASVNQMIREGRTSFQESATTEDILPPFVRSIEDKAPILKGQSRIADKITPNDDPADIARKVIADNVKVMAEALDQQRASIARTLADADAGDKLIGVPGLETKLHFDNDKITLTTDDGGTRTVSVRQLFEEQLDDNAEIQAVSSCSIR